MMTLNESLQFGCVPLVYDTCASFHEIINDGENGYLVTGPGQRGQLDQRVGVPPDRGRADPPEDFTSHYDRAEQGRVVDYVIIMGYDEHYVGSEAGSVASLPWVEQGIQDTLDEVPAERVINAIPFYTRLWRTTGGNVTSEAIGMDQAQQTIADNNVETYWDKTTSQNYGKYDIDNSTYQIWLEDAQSVAEKVKLVSKYDLAGVSAWKLGFENSGIWQVISDNLNN